MIRRSVAFALLLMPALLLIATPAVAQVQSGSVVVKAIDEQNTAVPGATVTLTSPVLPSPLVQVTDSTGVARFTSLAVATYAAKINMQGFQTINRTEIVVTQGQTVSIDVPMKVSSVTEEITVTA